MSLGKSGSASLAGALIIMAATASMFDMDKARSSTPQNKARKIWLTVMVTNTERDILDLPFIWPLDIEKENKKTFDSAEAYFTYLMSDGEEDKIHPDIMERIVADLSPDMVGDRHTVKPVANARTLPPGSSAWHVVCVEENDPPDMPFLISRNVNITDLRFPTETELQNPNDPEPRVGLKPGDPSNRVIWINRGGNVQEVAIKDAPANGIKLTRLVPLTKPAGRPDLKVLPALDAEP